MDVKYSVAPDSRPSSVLTRVMAGPWSRPGPGRRPRGRRRGRAYRRSGQGSSAIAACRPRAEADLAAIVVITSSPALLAAADRVLVSLATDEAYCRAVAR
ncbi:hypothetical protein GCM10010384_57450 [Streptomyces djakartensis]|uniref:Uncharacterized protein n=1 Tax=Streptomyces djakartensis TaxID=68193 RepID=A0ABQ3ADZ5_9ACTN|nr:hypothetical protein GCM10010384_57450 [Streptomyces djakartensis]